MTYDGLAIDESRDTRVGAGAAAILAREAIAAGIEKFVDAEAFAQWRARVALAARVAGKADLVAPTDEALAGIIARACEGASSFAELRTLGLMHLIDAALGEHRALVDRLAPLHLDLPRRKRVAIRYELEQPPWIASRMQDFFGLARAPTVGGGAVPLVLHLLAPNQRPVQVVERTRDQLRRIAKARDRSRDRNIEEVDESLKIAILAAFPDRVAKRRAPRSAEFVFAGGGSGTLSGSSAVIDAELIVAVDVAETGTRGQQAKVQIRRASAIDATWLLEYADRIAEKDVLEWNAAKQRVERTLQLVNLRRESRALLVHVDHAGQRDVHRDQRAHHTRRQRRRRLARHGHVRTRDRTHRARLTFQQCHRQHHRDHRRRDARAR